MTTKTDKNSGTQHTHGLTATDAQIAKLATAAALAAETKARVDADEQTAEALSDVASRIASLEASVAAHTSQIAGLGGRVLALETVVADLIKPKPPVVVPPPVIVPPPVTPPPTIPGPIPTGTTPPKALRDAIAAGSDATALMLSYLVSAAELDMDGLTAKVKQLHLDAWRGRHVYNGGITQTSVPSGGGGADAGLWWLTGDYQDIVLERLTLTGAMTGAPGVNEANHAIHPQGGANLTVRDCAISKFGGDGLSSSGFIPTGHKQNTNLVFAGNTVLDVGRMGISASTGLITAKITGNTIDRPGWYPVDIEPNGDKDSAGGNPETYTDILVDGNMLGRSNSIAIGRDPYCFVLSAQSLKTGAGKAEPVVARIVVSNNKALYAWSTSIQRWPGAVSMSGNR